MNSPMLKATFSGRTDCSLPGRCIKTLLGFACLLCVLPLLTSCGKKDSAKAAAGTVGPHIKWEFKGPGPGVSHPAISPDGTIYIGSNSALQAISPDGKLLWQTTLGGAGTPVVSDDGAIYLDSMHGSIFGVSKDGKLIWHPGYGLIGFGAPPALDANTTLYFLNSVSDIYAFQPKLSEEKLWSLDTFRENMLGASTLLPGSAQVGVFQRSAPVITSNGSILLPRQNFLDFVSPHGSPESDVEVSSGQLGQAALASGGTIYIGDDGAHLFALDSSGAQKWQIDLGSSVIGSPVIDADGVVYVCDGVAVFAVNPVGAIKWRWAPPTRIHLVSSPALAADGTIYVGGEFALIALKPDGSLKFNLRIYSPTSAPSIAPDGTIYFSCGYSWLCAVEDSGSPLMQSAWPKQFHDMANTSNILHGAN
jgi:outer membrane protein assembly factor BamB